MLAEKKALNGAKCLQVIRRRSETGLKCATAIFTAISVMKESVLLRGINTSEETIHDRLFSHKADQQFGETSFFLLM